MRCVESPNHPRADQSNCKKVRNRCDEGEWVAKSRPERTLKAPKRDDSNQVHQVRYGRSLHLGNSDAQRFCSAAREACPLERGVMPHLPRLSNLSNSTYNSSSSLFRLGSPSRRST